MHVSFSVTEKENKFQIKNVIHPPLTVPVNRILDTWTATSDPDRIFPLHIKKTSHENINQEIASWSNNKFY